MNSFIEPYFKTCYRPSDAFRSVLAGPYFRYGFLYMLIPTGFYTLMYVMLSMAGGAPSTFTPWLNIPKEEYYFYNQFLVAPSMFLAWFVSAAFVQSVSYAAGGRGTFEQTLSILGLSVSVAMWTTLLHDLVMSSLSALHLIDAGQHEVAMNTPTVWRTILWVCFAAYFFAFTVFFYRTVRTVHGIGRFVSFIIGFGGFYCSRRCF